MQRVNYTAAFFCFGAMSGQLAMVQHWTKSPHFRQKVEVFCCLLPPSCGGVADCNKVLRPARRPPIDTSPRGLATANRPPIADPGSRRAPRVTSSPTRPPARPPAGRLRRVQTCEEGRRGRVQLATPAAMHAVRAPRLPPARSPDGSLPQRRRRLGACRPGDHAPGEPAGHGSPDLGREGHAEAPGRPARKTPAPFLLRLPGYT